MISFWIAFTCEERGNPETSATWRDFTVLPSAIICCCISRDCMRKTSCIGIQLNSQRWKWHDFLARCGQSNWKKTLKKITFVFLCSYQLLLFGIKLYSNIADVSLVNSWLLRHQILYSETVWLFTFLLLNTAVQSLLWFDCKN